MTYFPGIFQGIQNVKSTVTFEKMKVVAILSMQLLLYAMRKNAFYILKKILFRVY